MTFQVNRIGIFGILSIMLSCSIFYGCGDNASSMDGSWEIEAIGPVEDSQALVESAGLTLAASGTVLKFEGSSVTIISPDKSQSKSGTYTFDKDSGKLSLSIGGKNIIYTLDGGQETGNGLTLKTEDGTSLISLSRAD